MLTGIRRAWARLTAVCRKERLDREFDDELGAHLAMAADENVRRGMSPGEARREAMLKLGGLDATRELHRETRGLPLLETLVQDVRYSLRALGREPVFFAVAVLIIGLGIGAATAIFSIVNVVMIRPLPFHEPQHLIWIANTGTDAGLSGVTHRASNLADWRRLNRSFADIGGYFAFYDYGGYDLTGEGEPERLVGVDVTQSFLNVLGVRPTLGRGFVDEECVWNGRKAALLTHVFWQRRFASDPRIVGRSLILNGDPTTIVGVLPPSFDFGSIFSPGSRVDLLLPFPVTRETDAWGNTLAVIGRLKSGVTIATAQTELDLINRQLQQADAGRWGLGAALTPLPDQITGRVRRAVLMLAGAVGGVLLVACANLSNLLLARGASRRRELAVRSALGAGRSRLIRQLLTESVVLASCGAALGVLIALAATRAIAGIQAIPIPLLPAVGIDGRALLFALGAAFATGLLFGSVPAVLSSRTGEQEALRDSDRGSTSGRSGAWIRRVLVVSEVALTLMLLVGAGLLLRSLLTLLDVDPGFRPEQAAAWRLDPGPRYPNRTERLAFYERVTRTLRDVPGVESVGLTDTLPLGRNRSWSVHAKGDPRPRDAWPDAYPRIVDPGYLTTMRIRMIAGRDITADDTARNEKVLIVNETMARRLWPGADPIGRIVLLGLSRDEWRVVGVVNDVHHSALEETAGLEMYLPVAQVTTGSMELVVRTNLSLEVLAPRVREALRSVDASLPTAEYQALTQLVDRAVSPRRFILLLLGIFALVALVLASLGIYGVVSYGVNQRTPEIGIRMALGASPAHVQVRVMGTTLALGLGGIAIGLLGSFVLSRLMASLLYGITPTDPLTFAAVVLVLAAVALLAGYLPARRASRIDPIRILRSG